MRADGDGQRVNPLGAGERRVGCGNHAAGESLQRTMVHLRAVAERTDRQRAAAYTGQNEDLLVHDLGVSAGRQASGVRAELQRQSGVYVRRDTRLQPSGAG